MVELLIPTMQAHFLLLFKTRQSEAIRPSLVISALVIMIRYIVFAALLLSESVLCTDSWKIPTRLWYNSSSAIVSPRSSPHILKQNH